jgi:hypothetical protein
MKCAFIGVAASARLTAITSQSLSTSNLVRVASSAQILANSESRLDVR